MAVVSILKRQQQIDYFAVEFCLISLISSVCCMELWENSTVSEFTEFRKSSGCDYS